MLDQTPRPPRAELNSGAEALRRGEIPAEDLQRPDEPIGRTVGAAGDRIPWHGRIEINNLTGCDFPDIPEPGRLLKRRSRPQRRQLVWIRGYEEVHACPVLGGWRSIVANYRQG